MNADEGVIYVLLDHFTRHLHPRAIEIENRLNAGERFSEADLVHVSEVFEDFKLLQPLIDRHPEHREFVQRVVALYAGLVKRGFANETSPGLGATPGSARGK